MLFVARSVVLSLIARNYISSLLYFYANTVWNDNKTDLESWKSFTHLNDGFVNGRSALLRSTVEGKGEKKGGEVGGASLRRWRR